MNEKHKEGEDRKIEKSEKSMDKIKSITALLLCMVVILAFFVIRQEKRWVFDHCVDEDSSSFNGMLTNKDGTASSATSGRLWTGTQVNSFPREKLLYGSFSAIIKENIRHNVSEKKLNCDHWSVVTTIFEPSDAIKLQTQLEGWCTVIVGDVKSPPTYEIPEGNKKNWVFLDVDTQKKMAIHYPMIELLPWSHFGRKNVGYLFAIMSGAKAIWDFDDDNILETPTKRMDIPKVFSLVGSVKVNDLMHRNLAAAIPFDVYFPQGLKTLAFNPYPLMGAPNVSCWPRGYPLEDIKAKQKITLEKKVLTMQDVGIIQSLANHDPDIDAIYRLTQKELPFSFLDSRAASKGFPVGVPFGSYSPYNAQASLHFYSALWSLYLPVTVHGRVSDIWRGYIFQRLAKDCKIHLLFSAPMVAQYRNEHNYLADFDSEDHLYKRSGKLLEQINAWSPTSSDLPGQMEELYVFMYEHGYLQLKDVELIQWWIKELISVEYNFPKCQASVSTK